MKLLQIVIAPPSCSSGTPISTTGPERRAANLAAKWRRENIEVIICYPSRGNMLGTFEAAGLEIVDYEIGNKANLFAVRQLFKIVKRHHIELIHTQGPPSLDLIASLAGRLTGVPVVATRPSMIEDQLTYAPWRRRLYAIIDRYITLPHLVNVIAVSQNGYERLRDHCRVPEHRLSLIYNGIELSRFSEQENNCISINNTDRPMVIGMIGQLFPSKYWQDFIEVIRRLKENNLEVRGLIVGEGELRAELESQVANSGLEKEIHFTGFQHDVRIPLAEMDVFLFTTRREGLSVAILEMMAAGVPVVATRVGGIEEQIEDQVSGYIVEPGDIDAMVERCTELIASPKLRYRFADAAKNKVQSDFTQQRMFDSHVKLYRKCISREGT